MVGVVTEIVEQQLIFTGLALLIQIVALLECLDKYIQFTYAIANKMTIRELREIWMHRHLFSIIQVVKPPEELDYMSDK